MDTSEALEQIRSGESSTLQFKANVYNETSIAQEMIAFSNTGGGTIIIGVDDKTWDIIGLSKEDINRLNNLVVNAAEQQVKPSIYITTENIKLENKLVMLIQVPKGTAIPYKDKDGIVWVKNGANKRKVTSNEELARLLQLSGYLYAEEKLIPHSTFADINRMEFFDFYASRYNEDPEAEKLPHYISNLRLGENNKLNIAGALLFGQDPGKLLPQFYVSAIWFYGNEVTDNDYRSSENMYGTLDRLYRKTFDFIVSKLDKIQPENRTFNSLGQPEVPEIVITELLVNALVHRDYFINDSIKIFVFENRIEIISPGSLPNNLTEEQIKKGIRRTRNNIIASLAPYRMEYRGAGSGILRALKAYPHFDIKNEKENERVVVIIERRSKSRPNSQGLEVNF